MALQLDALRDAPVEAGAASGRAAKAAEEVAAYDNRLGGAERTISSMEGRLHGIEGRLTMITWMIGAAIGLVCIPVAKALR